MKDVLNPMFWKERIDSAPPDMPHYSVYRIHPDGWTLIEERHRSVLLTHVGRYTNVLEVGCGYGRLLDLMPRDWKGNYLGIDLSPDFIAKAKMAKGGERTTFICGRAEDVLQTLNPKTFNLGVTVSIRNMLIDNGHESVWTNTFREMSRVCDRVLTLEYDPTSDGEVTT